jgi:hypothetical protein
MTPHFKVILFMACLLVFANACQKSEETAFLSETTLEEVSTTLTAQTLENLYVVGLENTGNGPLQAKLWNNGKATLLSAPSMAAHASSVFVSGTDVYATGSMSNNVGYWKNGVFKVLGSAPDIISTGSSIFVSNNDVYVAGYETNSNGSFFPLNIAKIWKNDKAIILGDSLTNSWANCVYVSGSDVYVAGTINNAAALWVNGVLREFTDGKNLAIATSVFKSGNDVYVVGQEFIGERTGSSNSIALLWKNGVVTYLTDGNSSAYAHSVSVSGKDVYVAGSSGISQAKLWKNGVPKSLTDGTKFGRAASVYVSGTDVYVGGSEAVAKDSYTTAKFWKNGAVFNISPDFKNTEVWGIFVKQ